MQAPQHNKVIRLARVLRKNMTPAEWKLWSQISRRQIEGIKFRRQHPIGSYIVDFYAPQIKLAIEVDGGAHMEQQGFDSTRTSILKNHGCKVIRFTNQEINDDLGEVLESIRAICVRELKRLSKI